MDVSFCFIWLDSVEHVAILFMSSPSIYAGYIESARRMVTDRIVLLKSSC